MKRTFSTLVIGLSVLAGLLIMPSSYAFWSLYRFEIHQDLTKDALVHPYEQLHFSDKAKLTIIKQHVNLDTESITPYSARDHFDSDKLTETYAKLVKRHADLIEAVRAEDQAAAWENLGKMLHTVQDFYSHSTWVWTSHVDIIDFGKALALESNGSPPSEIQAPGVGGCSPNDSTVSNAAGITTGFYPPLYPPAPANKCAHGSVSIWGAYYSNPYENPRPGIALDFPGFPLGPFDDSSDTYRNNAEKAQYLATRESVSLIKSIVQSIKDDDELGMCGVCLLTDNPDNEACNCDPLKITKILCSIEQRVSNQNPPVPYSVKRWTIEGIAKSSVAGAYVSPFPNPSLGIPTPAVVTHCSTWTGVYNYFGLAYCSYSSGNPSATSWTAAQDSPLNTQEVRAYLEYSLGSGPPVAPVIKSGLACPGSYTYE